MLLPGWNDVPLGYGARFEVSSAPVWLCVLFGTPFVDRFAHPLLVQCGRGVLTPHPGWPQEQAGKVDGGWRDALPDEPAPRGSIRPLTS